MCMSNVISFEYVDFSNKVHSAILSMMYNKFVDDYSQAGDTASKTDFDEVKMTEQQKMYNNTFFIKVNNQYAGFNILEAICSGIDDTVQAYVSDVVFVEQKFRKQGIMTQVRHLMRKYAEQQYNIPVIGSSMSSKRIRKYTQHLKNNGFKFVYLKNGQDLCSEGVHLVTYDVLKANFVDLYPVKVPLNSQSIDKLDKLSRKILVKQIDIYDEKYLNKYTK